MVYHLHIPAVPLNAYVADIFYYEAGIAPYEAEKLLPDNTVYLIINLTEQPKKLFTDTSLHNYTAYKKAWVSGMQKKYIVIEATNNNAMLIVRFKPGGAYPFFRIPIQAFAEIVVEGDDVLGSKILSLREELYTIADPEAKCKRMEEFLVSMLYKCHEVNPVVGFLTERLSDTRRVQSLKELVAQTGYSHKHIISLFEQYVGLTPKYFARICKFQEVLKCIDRQQYVSWTSIANEYGFYDQAHFIHEFKKFSGVNPSGYLLAKGDTYNYLPVNYTTTR